MDSESMERHASEKLDSIAQSCYEHHPRLQIWCEDCPLGSDKSGSGWSNSSSQAWKHNFQYFSVVACLTLFWPGAFIYRCRVNFSVKTLNNVWLCWEYGKWHL